MTKSEYTRRELLKTIGAGAASLAIPGITCGRGGNQEKPNILFVMADQFRRHSMGFMKQDPVKTPNFDEFAGRGVVFTNAVSSFPLCSPFRAMLMTGKFPLSSEVTNNCQAGLNMEMKEDEICISDILKENGWQTGYIGKWHLEMPPANRMKDPPDGSSRWDGWTPPGPRRHGFDFWYAYNTFDRHFSPHYWRNSPEKIEIKDWSVKHETDVAADFIRKRDKNRPFALFLSWNPPHPPRVAPERFLQMYKDDDVARRPNVKSEINIKQHLGYYAAVSSCDHNFGRLMKILEQEGIAENTIVVFTTDHGEMLQSHGRWSKNIWYEESIGIPFMVRWPERIKSRREDMLLASYDFMPTMLGLAGLPVPGSVEGTDYSNVLLGGDVQKPSSVFLAKYPNTGELLAVGQKPTKWVQEGVDLRNKGIDWRTIGYRGIRTERYTYVVNRQYDGKTAECFLYDNKSDPYQLNPVSTIPSEKNEVMAGLDKELRNWLDKLNDPFPLN